MDHYAGALAATRHLIEQGCGRIGLVNGPLEWWVARERQSGWGDALRSAGLPHDADAIAYGDWSAVSGERALLELLGRRPELDAVVAGNDQMALGALRAAHLRGIRVPEELAVVGFDNTPESAVYWPALTTVHLRHLEIGRLAVERLVELIETQREDGEKARAITDVLTPELVVRESSLRRPLSVSAGDG
jgi:DNA-binding LacI/PurR family transcriptional regulator